MESFRPAYRLGRIHNKHLILEILCLAYDRDEAASRLFKSCRNLRALYTKNRQVVETIFSSQEIETVEICMLDDRIDYMVASERQMRKLKLDIKIGNAKVDELFKSVVKIVRWRKSMFWKGWAGDRITICFCKNGEFNHNALNLERQASLIQDIPLNLEYRP